MHDTFSKACRLPRAPSLIAPGGCDCAATQAAAWRAVGFIVFACGTLGVALPAQAELHSTALVRVASNYLYHGYTKSDDHPVTQLHGGASHGSGMYGGAWLSQLDFGGAQLELIPYLGVQRKLGEDFRLDGSVSGYIYEAKVYGQRANYGETAISLAWRGLLSARFSVAFDSYGSNHTTLAGELKGRYPISDVIEITGGVGFDRLSAVTHYDALFWNMGLSYFLGAHMAVDVRYVDNVYWNEPGDRVGNSRFETAEVGARVMAALSIGF